MSCDCQLIIKENDDDDDDDDRESKKGATLTMAITFDLQNSSSAAKSTKFPTKLILDYSPCCCITLENLKIRNLHFSCT